MQHNNSMDKNQALTSQRLTSLLEDAPQRVGMLAGWGGFPIEVAETLRDQGKELFVAAFKGHADSRLEHLARDMRWFGVLKIGAHLRYFQQAGVRQVIMAGKLFKNRILYQGWGWLGHLPDWTCCRILGPSFLTRTRDARDDTILNAVTNAYLQRGIEVLPVTDVAPRLLCELGCLTRRQPTSAQMSDVLFGWNIARCMGGLDVGQSITVRDQMVLGVEAIEGTDGLIQRTASLCPRGGFTLVKVAKPRQDMRFDVPTIGLRTVQQMSQAGGQVIAIESDKTILVDRQATLDFANDRGLSIVALGESAALPSTDNPWLLGKAKPVMEQAA